MTNTITVVLAPAMARPKTKLMRPVRHIVLVRTEKEVTWPNTARVIAVMANTHIGRYRTDIQPVREPMSELSVASKHKTRVFLWTKLSSNLPAAACLLEFPFKTINYVLFAVVLSCIFNDGFAHNEALTTYKLPRQDQATWSECALNHAQEQSGM